MIKIFNRDLTNFWRDTMPAFVVVMLNFKAWYKRTAILNQEGTNSGNQVPWTEFFEEISAGQNRAKKALWDWNGTGNVTWRMAQRSLPVSTKV
jgi:hypothetical protein